VPGFDQRKRRRDQFQHTRGEEVVELYVKYPGSAVPAQQAAQGFKRVAIAAGATSTVTMTLPYRDIAYWIQRLQLDGENGSVPATGGGSSRTRT